MLPVLNTDLVLTSRKDTRQFVLELRIDISTYPVLQTNFRIQYVALLKSYVYDSYDSVRLNDVLRTKWQVYSHCRAASDY